MRFTILFCMSLFLAMFIYSGEAHPKFTIFQLIVSKTRDTTISIEGPHRLFVTATLDNVDDVM